MEEIRICRNCKWHKFVSPLRINEWCSYEQEVAPSSINIVTGKEVKKVYKISCETSRSNIGHCGHEGKDYSPSFKKRVIQWVQNGIFSFPSK